MNKEIPQVQNANEHSPKISDAEQEAFDLLIPKHKELAIQLDDFEGVKGYTTEEIRRDKEAVERKKSRMEDVDSPVHHRAQLLEAIIAEQIELSDWFGEDVMTIIPSEYDDLFNGVDLAAEFKKEDNFQYLGMSIDVISGPGSIKIKLDHIRDNLEEGTPGRMKYLLSERSDIKKKMDNLPSFIVGADPRTIHELAELWLTANRLSHTDQKELNQSEIDELRAQAKEAKAQLAKHRARALILTQIIDQLETFIEFAKSIKAMEIEDKYKNLQKIFKEALTKISISAQKERENESDDVYRSLKEGLQSFAG